MRYLFHAVAVILVTLLTQLGGIAWLISLTTRWRAATFIAAYAGLSLLAWHTAPLFGRAPIPCHATGPLQMQSWFYCVTNRNYVVPELATLAKDLAAAMHRRAPGTITLALDGNFPFLTGFPLLPHLSHDDGRKLDLAFYYADPSGRYLPGATRSPLGYFAYEDGPTPCPPHWPSLRWDLAWLQPLFPAHQLEPGRMTAMLGWLAADRRVGRVFIEPHLRARLNIPAGPFGFQGCRAARHDDHVHIQL